MSIRVPLVGELLAPLAAAAQVLT